jgi:hypothetical protein
MKNAAELDRHELAHKVLYANTTKSVNIIEKRLSYRRGV